MLGAVLVASVALGTITALAAPVITLQPTCGPVGATVQVTGSGWAPGYDITIAFDPQGTPPYSVTVPGKSIGPNGTFTTNLIVPSRPNRGTAYQVQASQQLPAGLAAGTRTAQAPFRLPCPALTLNPTCGSVGVPVAVHGEGFQSDVQVEISFTPPAGTKPLATPIPKPDGTFDVTITVPPDPPGAYVVTAVQLRTQLTASAAFQIPCVKAAIKLLPTVGPPGTVTTVTGTGFPVGAVVKLSWSQGIPLTLASITIGATQGFQLTLLIFPHDQLGLRHLSAAPDLSVTSAPLFNIATADFLVVAGTSQPRDFSWRH